MLTPESCHSDYPEQNLCWYTHTHVSYDFQYAFAPLWSSSGELKGKVSYGVDDDDNNTNHVGKDLERPLTKKTIVTVEGTESLVEE